VEQYVRQTLERAREVGNPRAQSLCLHALGAVLQLLGRWPESVASLTESVRLSRSFDGEFGEVLGEQRLAQIETAVGLFEQARSRLDRALTLARASSSPIVRAHSLGRVYSSFALSRYEAGDLEEAARFLARGFATQQVVGKCAGCDVLLYPAAIPIYLALGDLDLAAEAGRKAEETAGAFRSRSWIATSRYLNGLLAAAQEVWSAAELDFEEATTTFEHLGQPYEMARALEGLALARSRSRGSAQPSPHELLERASDTYRALGAPYRASKADLLRSTLT
jgi:tetratricopeptide (TPR) repeat protein